MAELSEIVKARRQAIQRAAPCEGCGSSLEQCLAERGKDPTAPPWFGCCARGLYLDPCHHVVSPHALAELLREVESGSVRTVEEVEDQALIGSIREYRFDPDRIMRWWRDNPDLAMTALEDATWD